MCLKQTTGIRRYHSHMSAMNNLHVEIRRGVPEDQTLTAARLYCTALRAKLDPFLVSPDRAARVLASGIRPDRAVVALAGGEVVGIAGFKSGGRGVFEPATSAFLSEFGRLSGSIRMLGLALLERSERDDSLLMDGIAVAPQARGCGVGTRLLREIVAVAKDAAASAVRLDVIDTNPRARALYERFGFRPTRTTRLFFTRLLFPFSASTEMVLSI
jgi:ribosomal protein S18 acetylase RimI-like enzyme